MKRIWKYIIITCMVICMGLQIEGKAEASDSGRYGYSSYEEFKRDRILKNKPTFYTPSGISAKTKKVTFTWEKPFDADENYGYELQLSKKSNFSNVMKFKSNTESVSVKRSKFGSNGGSYYCRVRMWALMSNGEMIYGKWSDTAKYTFVKINKTNFPGMYKMLKNGVKYQAIEHKTGKKVTIRIKYDANKDGWIDPVEVNNIGQIRTNLKKKKKNGKYYYEPDYKISSLKGIHYFTELEALDLDHYSGKEIDLSKNKKVNFVSVRGITSSQLTVNTPTATFIDLEADLKKSLKKYDLSKCKKATEIVAYGNKATKALKLPADKGKLKILSVKEMNFSTLSLNAYKKLTEVYVYESKLKTLKVNKCSKLKYVYFYCCDRIKGIDLRANKNLRGVDFFACNSVNPKKVKVRSKAKVTYNQGKWWY